MHGLRTRKVTARFIAVAVITLSSLAGLIGVASASPVTTAKSGSPGYWGGDTGPNYCDNLFGGYVSVISPYITRSPSYPNSTQTIWLRSRVEVWNGSAWVTSNAGVWESRQVPPGQNLAHFSGRQQPVATGRYYRVVQFYQWNVGATTLGTATNLFDQYSYSGYWVAATGTSASHCFVPAR